MTWLRVILLVLPATVVAALLQAFLWVPTYETQGQNNPRRLATFVEGSIGDARLLNPILNADTASARIVDLMFDGLLRIGENLELTPSLAERWQVNETAWLLVRDEDSARRAALTVQRALDARDPGLLLEPVTVVPALRRTVTAPPAPQAVTLDLPPRVRMRLRRVVPDLEQWLREALGSEYDAGIGRGARIGYSGDAPEPAARAALEAELLPALEHNPELTFWLRKDVRFHDGHAFDSGDVKFTYEAIMAPHNRSPRRSGFEPIQSVVALDAHTVRVTYRQLFSPAVNAWTIGILPEHLLDAGAMDAEMDRRRMAPDTRERFGMRDSEFNRNPLGTGAFRFGRWTSDELIHLTRNEDYWSDVPIYVDYYFRVIPDALTQEIEFRAGALDTYAVEPHQAERYRRNPRYRAFSSVVPGYTYIGYNLRKAPFTDPDVRRALGMAIDTEAIIRYALFNEGERITGPYANITEWYDHSVSPLPYDPPAALALLKSRGFRRGADGWLERDGTRLEFNLITNNGNLRRKAVASIVQQAWQRIGVKCNVQLFEWAVFLKDFVNPGQFDAVVLGWRLDLDPDLHPLWHSSQSNPNQLNFVGYADPESDRLIERIRLEYDSGEQRRLAHALHRRIAALQPYTFLFAPRSTRLLDRKIVMRDAAGNAVPIRAGGAGDLFFHMNRWQRLAHDPGF